MKNKFSIFLILFLTVFSGFSAAIFAEEIETEKTWPANDGFEIFKQNEKLGVRTTAGEVVVDPEYDEITVGDTFSVLHKADETSTERYYVGRNTIALTKTWEIILQSHLRVEESGEEDNYGWMLYVSFFGEQEHIYLYFPLYIFGGVETENIILYIDDDRRYYFVNKQGELLGNKSWKKAEVFSEGLAYVVNDRGEEVYINTKGEEVIPYSKEWTHEFGRSPFSNGLAKVETPDGWGYINTAGEITIKGIWEWGNHFYDGLAMVKGENGNGYINTKGEEVIPCKYEGGSVFSDGVAKVWHNDKTGLIDQQGNYILQPEWKGIYTSQEIKVPVKGWVSDDETMKIFNDGIVLAYKEINEDRIFYYLNEKGDIVSSGWKDASVFHEGFGIVQDEQGYGIVDTKGVVRRLPQEVTFDTTLNVLYFEGFIDDSEFIIYTGFIEGLLRTPTENGKIGFLNKDLEWAVQPVWDSAKPFYKGLAVVEKEEKFGLINQKGELVVPLIYDEIQWDETPNYDLRAGMWVASCGFEKDVYNYKGEKRGHDAENGVYIYLNE